MEIKLELKKLSEQPGIHERPIIIAGPCSAESEEQVVSMETAHQAECIRGSRS